MGTFALYCGCLDDGDLLIVSTAHDPTQLLLTMLSVGQLRLCSDVLNFVAFVWSLLIFKTRNAFLNYLTLLTLTLCWCLSCGLWQSIANPLEPKNHGRLPKSIFRLGFDFLRHFISILIPSLTLPTLVSNPILASNKWDTLSSLLIH